MRRMSIKSADEDQTRGAGSSQRRRRSSAIEPGPREPSRIADFYAGRAVFLTGASGFIGKLLLEKLLRSCPNVGRVFVLIRARRGKSAGERLRELFDSPVFQARASGPAGPASLLAARVELLEGDLTEPLLGLDGEAVRRLAAEVSVVFHSAAIVSFDKRLRASIRTNLAGTGNVLELASRLPRLAAFVHVSTCYSNCTRAQVDEHIYPVDVEPRQVIRMAECLDEERLELLRAQLVGSFPNPYTYTKHLAEHLVGQYGLSKGLPVLICRPSIVIGTLREPLVGFADNRNGMNGIYCAMNRGLLRVALGRSGSLMDQVPADVVANCIIALGWFADLYHRVGARLELNEPAGQSEGPLAAQMAAFYRERGARLALKLASDDSLGRLKEEERGLLRVPVCHVSSGAENPVGLEEMLGHVARGAQKYPSLYLFRQPLCRVTPNRPLHAWHRFWFHTIAGCLLDLFAVERPTGRGKRLSWSQQMRQVDRFMSVLSYFKLNSWHFNPETRQKLISDFMNDEDRRLFNCDTASIEWGPFGDRIAFGLRKYVLGEDEQTIAEARLKYRSTCWRNTALQLLLVSAACWVFYLLILA